MKLFPSVRAGSSYSAGIFRNSELNVMLNQSLTYFYSEFEVEDGDEADG